MPLFVIGFVALGVGGSITAFNAGSDALDNFTSSIDAATNGTSHARRLGRRPTARR